MKVAEWESLSALNPSLPNIYSRHGFPLPLHHLPNLEDRVIPILSYLSISPAAFHSVFPQSPLLVRAYSLLDISVPHRLRAYQGVDLASRPSSLLSEQPRILKSRDEIYSKIFTITTLPVINTTRV